MQILTSIHKIWGEREVKVETSLWLKLRCYQLKIDVHNSNMSYVSLIMVTKKNPVVDKQNIKRKEWKHTTAKEIVKSQRKKQEKEREKKKTHQKGRKQQDGNSKSLPLKKLLLL